MPAPTGNDYAKGNKGGGRPSEYREEFAEQAEKLCRLGATDAELADFFEVSEQTINNWKKEYKEFSLSLKRGKLLADAEVADKLYHRATGYEHKDTYITQYQGQIIKEETIKHYPPDTTAGIFWLKNRQPDKWRDKQDLGISDDSIESFLRLSPEQRSARIVELKTQIENEKRRKQKTGGV